MSRRDWDLVAVFALATLAELLIIAGAPSGLPRAFVTLPLVLLLPGYAVSAGLFPDGSALNGTERTAMTIALSLAVSVVGGLVLQLTPWGVQVTSWALWLGLVTWVGTIIAYLRRQRLPLGQDLPPRLPAWEQLLPIALAVVLGFGAIGISVAGAIQPRGEPFTQLWLLPDALEGAPAVDVGVYNGEGDVKGYRLVVYGDGAVLAEWQELVLSSGETATWVVPLPSSASGVAVSAELYLNEAPETLYRAAHLQR